MYYYLVDSALYDGRNFEYQQSRLLSLLGEYHIAGEAARVTKLRSVEDLVKTALSHGVTTLVVVGGDETFARVTSVCHGKQVTLGYIPIHSRSELARILGIGELADAVATIAKRRVESLDIAKIGQTYFISSLHFGASQLMESPMAEDGWLRSVKKWLGAEPFTVGLMIDGSFRVKVSVLAGSIVNARDNQWYRRAGGRIRIGNPKDQRLDLTLAGTLTIWQAWRYRSKLEHGYYEAVPGGSVFHGRSIEITGPEGLPIYLSGHIIARAPAVVEMTDEVVRVVVGRERQF